MSEWIYVDMDWDGFCDHGFNKPGVLIEFIDDIDTAHIKLIGDINELGGECDCCKQIKREHQVTRYKVVWTPG